MFILDLAYCLIMLDQVFNFEYMCNCKGNYGFSVKDLSYNSDQLTELDLNVLKDV